MEKIISKLYVGQKIETPTRRSTFTIDKVNRECIKIKVGIGGWPITIPDSCFEGVPNFLRGKGWIKIGARHGVPDKGTFDEYVQGFTNKTSAASYVAPILEIAEIVEIDRRVPNRIKLIK